MESVDQKELKIAIYETGHTVKAEIFGIKSPIRIWIWVAFAALFFGFFFAMTSEVREVSMGQHELIGVLDQSISSFAGSIRNPKLNAIAVDITALGSGTVLTIFVILVSSLLILIRKYLYVLHLFSAAIGSTALTYVMKAYFERPRPSGLEHLVNVQGYSYPSGHSLSSAAIYFTFAILLFFNFRNRKVRIFIISSSLIFISLIALSRIYLGVHYLSDVIAGVLVGVGWASILAAARIFVENRSTIYGTK